MAEADAAWSAILASAPESWEKARGLVGFELKGKLAEGATAWHFARYEQPVFDYLVVDEAGHAGQALQLTAGDHAAPP